MSTHTARLVEIAQNFGFTRGNLDVLLGDQTTQPLDSLFAQSTGIFTLAADTVESGITSASLVYTFTAAPAHGIIIGSEILLLDPVLAADRSFYAEVLNVAGDVITVDRPIDHVFPVASTLGRIVITNMAVDGSVTPQIFSLRAGAVPIDLVRVIINMTDDSSMDDSLFGGLPALTRGLSFRILNGFQKTIFDFKTNGEVSLFCFDTKYASRAPAGDFGFTGRITFGGQSKHGVVLRISGTDVLQWVVQDDLTDLLTLKIAAQGHRNEASDKFFPDYSQ